MVRLEVPREAAERQPRGSREAAGGGEGGAASRSRAGAAPQVPRETRVARLVAEYGSHAPDELAECVMSGEMSERRCPRERDAWPSATAREGGPAHISAYLAPARLRCVLKLERKLGSGRAASLVSLLLDRSPPALDEVADLLLTHYYDSMYEHQAKKRPGAVETLPCDTADADAAAAAILRHVGC